MTLDELKKIWEKKNGGKFAPSEHDLQVSCVRWFRYQFPNEIIMAIPNGGYRTAKTAAIMKAEGQMAGIPDLFIAAARGGKHGLWIEMKNGKAGRLSPIQKEVHERLQNQGYQVEVVRNDIAFRDIVTKYIKQKNDKNPSKNLDK